MELPGEEFAETIPANAVDWILVELRDAPTAAAATSETIFTRLAGFLMNDGAVLSADGSTHLMFYDILEDQLFAVIWHRNHLGMMSANPLSEAGGIFSYDFSSGAGQAYNSGQKEIAPEAWGMVAGDADASNTIDMTDKTEVWNLQAGRKGYLSGDLNMNAEVDNFDKNGYWLPNMGEESQVQD